MPDVEAPTTKADARDVPRATARTGVRRAPTGRRHSDARRGRRRTSTTDHRGHDARPPTVTRGQSAEPTTTARAPARRRPCPVVDVAPNPIRHLAARRPDLPLSRRRPASVFSCSACSDAGTAPPAGRRRPRAGSARRRAKASATSLGPATVTQPAPTDGGQRLGLGAVVSARRSPARRGPGGRLGHVARHRGPAVRQQDGDAPGGAVRSSCGAGGPQRAGDVGRAVAPQREQVVHDLLGGRGVVLALGARSTSLEKASTL